MPSPTYLVGAAPWWITAYIVGKEDVGTIKGFKVMILSEVVEEEMRCEGGLIKVPDHSSMLWEVHGCG